MSEKYGNDKKSAVDAKTDAQKIAFAPLMFQAAKALRDFGILRLLLKSKEGLTPGEVAGKVNISKYGATVLLEAGLSLEMVYLENGKYKLTKTGFFVERDEMTRANMDFANDINYLGAYYLQEAIKTGKPAGLHKAFGNWNTVYEALSELPDDARKSWFDFDHFYSDVAFDEILKIVFSSKPEKIVDLGGNTGKFAIACAGYNSDVRVTIMDLPGQLENAKANIREHGFEERIDTFQINFLDKNSSFPEGYDVFWLSQFLDCFSEEEIVSILSRAKNVMNPDSELFILETFWDDQKFKATTYSLHATSLYFTCIANGNSRMYHSGDMKKLIEESGLYIAEKYSDIGLGHTLLRCRKRVGE